MRVDVNGVGIECEVTGDGPAWSSEDPGPWRYERLDGPGHWLQLEAPSEVNRLLIDFLSA